MHFSQKGQGRRGEPDQHAAHRSSDVPHMGQTWQESLWAMARTCCVWSSSPARCQLDDRRMTRRRTFEKPFWHHAERGPDKASQHVRPPRAVCWSGERVECVCVCVVQQVLLQVQGNSANWELSFCREADQSLVATSAHACQATLIIWEVIKFCVCCWLGSSTVGSTYQHWMHHPSTCFEVLKYKRTWCIFPTWKDGERGKRKERNKNHKILVQS